MLPTAMHRYSMADILARSKSCSEFPCKVPILRLATERSEMMLNVRQSSHIELEVCKQL